MSGPPLVLTEIIEEECMESHYCYVQALANMNEQDVNGNGWPGSGCYIDGYLCSDYFLTFFL